jgi:glycosyltransferase involved in cell wall biosynthesis
MIRSTPKVAIVLATFNGGQFLIDQLQSLSEQSFAGWQLWVRDDGSADATCDILRRAVDDDSRIHIVEDNLGRLGTARSFGELLRRVSKVGVDYVFLCDQDDVWRPDKVARQLNALRAAETDVGCDQPVLVHSDLAIVDAELRPVAPSFASHLRLRPESTEPLRTLLVQNFVTGSTIAINRPLLELALPFPDDVILHDWWLGLLAASAGELRYLAESLVMYRQHLSNQVGAIGFWKRLADVLSTGQRGFQNQQERLLQSVKQGAALECRLCERLSAAGGALHETVRGNLDLVRRYLSLFEACRSRWQRPWGVLNLRIGRQMWLKQAAFLMQVGLLPHPVDPNNRRRAA